VRRRFFGDVLGGWMRPWRVVIKGGRQPGNTVIKEDGQFTGNFFCSPAVFSESILVHIFTVSLTRNYAFITCPRRHFKKNK
jgi:hypothetical protein